MNIYKVTDNFNRVHHVTAKSEEEVREMAEDLEVTIDTIELRYEEVLNAEGASMFESEWVTLDNSAKRKEYGYE